MKKFKPLLAVDATDYLDTINYPKYASYKLDGIRCIFHPKLGMVSRALKPIQNKQLQEKFKVLINFSATKGIILDGELYGHDLTFQQITGAVMTQDFLDEKTIKKITKRLSLDSKDSYDAYVNNLLPKIKFNCFDYLEDINDTFDARCKKIDTIDIFDGMIIVEQKVVNSKKDVLRLFKEALKDGYEGLILRGIDSPYKFGRATLKEEYCLKVKLFETFDAEIINVQQATEVDSNAERKTNELGRSVTSKKKGDRILINKASAFMVKYNEETVKVSLAMTDEEKEEVWKNKESYIGRIIEYKGMQIGAKNVPRHPVFVRFRDDKE